MSWLRSQFPALRLVFPLRCLHLVFCLRSNKFSSLAQKTLGAVLILLPFCCCHFLNLPSLFSPPISQFHHLHPPVSWPPRSHVPRSMWLMRVHCFDSARIGRGRLVEIFPFLLFFSCGALCLVFSLCLTLSLSSGLQADPALQWDPAVLSRSDGDRPTAHFLPAGKDNSSERSGACRSKANKTLFLCFFIKQKCIFMNCISSLVRIWVQTLNGFSRIRKVCTEHELTVVVQCVQAFHNLGTLDIGLFVTQVQMLRALNINTVHANSRAWLM